ncbi:hypothetical protein CYMTET_9744 [Cymbomonas tetramitiformis]|uniref:Uncharacterized protein n=1 Tax=Cymbomonas tetramitiformis TaxID=36881 RepID=A0AAE0GQH7_9CHLO|nr:hypothetical protein CYMTET_9744 [Cymbomonas tetramitiformis]
MHCSPMFSTSRIDVITRVRVEANKLPFSTLELIADPMSPAADWLEASAETSPHDGERVLLETARMLLDAGTTFQGKSELLGIRFLSNVNPHVRHINFNAALASAKLKNTLDTEDIKGLFIDALDKAGVTGGLSAATFTVNTEEKSAIADLTSILLDLQRQVKTLSSRMNDTKNSTPRGAKPRGKMIRFAARDLPAGGNWSQSEQKRRVVFHKSTGEFILFCANDTCALESARHWHRDCPNGGKAANKKEFGSHSFDTIGLRERHVRGAAVSVRSGGGRLRQVRHALLLGGGRASRRCATRFRHIPSASPLVVPLRHSVSTLRIANPWTLPWVRGFHVGGASDGVPSFATVEIDGVHVDTTKPPPPLSDDGTHGDVDDRVHPAADSVHFV